MKLTGAALAALQKKLLHWYARSRRQMPWRGTRDAYRVWVSEIMLQQTRVATVAPYYEKFMRQFPTVQALARARAESVLKLWAGLGYYSRARNLHRAAQEIVARHDGKFPRERRAALALPGIGRYTAAAVLSIAYGQPMAALDGNVARVLARLAAVRGDLRKPRRWKQLEERAQRLLAPTQPGEWNQAMMELGATICTPRAPRCEPCPLARWCAARKLGIADQVPTGRKKPAAVKVRVAAAVLLDADGRTLLVRENDGLFSKMWQFPAVEVKRDAGAELRAHLRGLVAKEKTEEKSKTLTQRKPRAAEFAEKKKTEDKTKTSTQRTQRSTEDAERKKPRERQEDLTQRSQRITEESIVALEGMRHSVTFREITLLPFLVRVPGTISNLKFEISETSGSQPLRFLASAKSAGAGSTLLTTSQNDKLGRVRVVGLEKVDGMAVSSATRKIARAVARARPKSLSQNRVEAG